MWASCLHPLWCGAAGLAESFASPVLPVPTTAPELKAAAPSSAVLSAGPGQAGAVLKRNARRFVSTGRALSPRSGTMAKLWGHLFWYFSSSS